MALWMAWHFEDSTIHYFIPDGDAEVAVWEIGKDAFKSVLNSNRLLLEAITRAIGYGFADTEEEVIEFLKDAVASESSDDIVRLEWW